MTAAETETPQRTDYELAQKAAQGDMGAFEELYQRHNRRVYSLCLRMTGNVAEAEDLAQEVFIQLFRKIGSFRGESAFTTWLHRLTVNQVLMHFRKRGVRMEQTTEDGETPTQIVKGTENPNSMPVVDRIGLLLPLPVHQFENHIIRSIGRARSRMGRGGQSLNLGFQGLKVAFAEDLLLAADLTAAAGRLHDFALLPHLDHADHPESSMSKVERMAAEVPVPTYAIDDQTALKVIDGAVEVISEGNWKRLTPQGANS